jgi:hypothetical protein
MRFDFTASWNVSSDGDEVDSYPDSTVETNIVLAITVYAQSDLLFSASISASSTDERTYVDIDPATDGQIVAELGQSDWVDSHKSVIIAVPQSIALTVSSNVLVHSRVYAAAEDGYATGNTQGDLHYSLTLEPTLPFI